MNLNKTTCSQILNSHKRGRFKSMACQLQGDWNFKERGFTIRLLGSPYSDYCSVCCIWNILNGDHFKFKSEEELKYFLDKGQRC